MLHMSYSQLSPCYTMSHSQLCVTHSHTQLSLCYTTSHSQLSLCHTHTAVSMLHMSYTQLSLCYTTSHTQLSSLLHNVTLCVTYNSTAVFQCNCFLSDHQAHFTNISTYHYLTSSFLTCLNADDFQVFSPTGNSIHSFTLTQHME